MRLGGRRFLCLTGTRLGFTRFTGGYRGLIVRLAIRLNHDHIRRFLIPHPCQRGLNGILILRVRLDSGFFVTFQARGFFPLQSLLAGFKARFGLGGALLFKLHGAYFGFLLAEILDQRNIARADPGAGAALNTIGKIVRGGFVMLLPFTEPVKLLGKQIRRAGVGTGATANAVLLFLLFAHFTTGWG